MNVILKEFASSMFNLKCLKHVIGNFPLSPRVLSGNEIVRQHGFVVGELSVIRQKVYILSLFISADLQIS